MDVKIAFLNGSLEETIHMVQLEGFIAKGQEKKVCKLQKSIYGLKQASRSWKLRFDQAVKLFRFLQSPDEPCVYKRCSGNVVVFLILYVDDILLIGNNVGTLSSVKVWLSGQFDMKDLGEAVTFLGSSFCEIARKECWAYPTHPISMRFSPDSACKILRKDLFLSELKFIYQLISGLRLLLR